MDTMGAKVSVAAVLLIVVIFLNVITWIVYRNKRQGRFEIKNQVSYRRFIWRRVKVDILFVLFLFVLIIYLNIGLYLPFQKVDEKDIERNLRNLKKHQWFQNYLEDKKLRELIIHDKDVRKSIGKLNSKKIERNSYQKRCQKKLQRVLIQRKK